MKKICISLAAMMVMILSSLLLHAQTNPSADSIYYIILKDGTTINGTLKEKTEKEVYLNSKNFGVVSIPVDSIRKMDVLAPSAYKNGKFWFPNPNATRYVVSPSAIPLNKGEGYFQNTYLFLCTINYGITGNISIGGGTDVISPFVKNSGGPSALLNLKAGFHVAKNFYAGGTTLLLRAPVYDDKAGKEWSTYFMEDAMFTFGNPDDNLTLGIGYGLKNGYWQPAPTMTLSGMARVTPRFSFVSENWMLPVPATTYDESGNIQIDTKYEMVFSYGMRFMSQKIAVDFGFINQKDIAKEIFIGIPYVDFVVKF